MYGGYTFFNDRRIKYDINTLYNPQVYENVLNLDIQEQLQYEERPNYIGSEGSTIISKLPHLSSYVGFSAALGAFNFNTQRLFRADHSSLGLNPFAVSYADPQSLIGEEILSTSIDFKKSYSNWDFKVTLNSLNYTINPLSSYKYVLPLFGTISNSYSLGFFAPTNIDPTINAPVWIDSLYLSGSRYVSSNFNDFSIEMQANFHVNKSFDLSVGIQTESGFGDAIERYQSVPKSTITGFILPTVLDNPIAAFSSISTFIEGYLKFGNFSVIAGAQGFIRSDKLKTNDPVFNPRIGLLFRPNPKFSLRASFSQAFRYPSAFYNSSSYKITAKDGFIDILPGSSGLEPEQTINVEAGLRFSPSEFFNLDGSLYYTKTTNFINFDFTNGNFPGSFFWGYDNDPNSFVQLIGGQVSLHLKNIWPAIKLSTDINLNYSNGKEKVLQLFIGEFQGRQLQDLPAVRAQPEFIGHVRMSVEPFKSFTIFLNHSFMTSSWTRNKFRITMALQNNQPERLKNAGYYTLGMRSQLKISRQLNAYVDLANLMNIQYAGIDATVHIDGYCIILNLSLDLD